MKSAHAALLALLSMLTFPTAGLGLLLGALSLPNYAVLSLASLAGFVVSLVRALRPIRRKRLA